jgi:hypothetical protein
MTETEQPTSHITITVELAQAAARIAARHPDGAVRIEYYESQPENVWRVTALGVTDEETKEYAVNDETGKIHAINCDMDEDCVCGTSRVPSEYELPYGHPLRRDEADDIETLREQLIATRSTIREFLNGASLNNSGRFVNPRYEALYRAITA